MRTLDIETILICAVMAIAGTLGIVAGGAAFMGIHFQECNTAALTGICCGISGATWAFCCSLTVADGQNIPVENEAM